MKIVPSPPNWGERARVRGLYFHGKKPENAFFCHSREGGNPVFESPSGLPLPACTGTGFAGVTTWRTFYESIKYGSSPS
jgi:hypothetical protein